MNCRYCEARKNRNRVQSLIRHRRHKTLQDAIKEGKVTVIYQEDEITGFKLPTNRTLKKYPKWKLPQFPPEPA